MQTKLNSRSHFGANFHRSLIMSEISKISKRTSSVEIRIVCEKFGYQLQCTLAALPANKRRDTAETKKVCDKFADEAPDFVKRDNSLLIWNRKLLVVL
jgi:hypothetical protein